MLARIFLPLLLLDGLLFAPFSALAQTQAITPESITTHPAWQAFESWNRGINSWFSGGFKDMVQGIWQGAQSFRLPRYEEFNWPVVWNVLGGGIGSYVQNAQRDISSSNPSGFGSKVSEYAKTAGDNAPGLWVRVRAAGDRAMKWLFGSGD